MIWRRSHRKSVSRLVIKPRFPDLPLNAIITRPSFPSVPTLSIKYLTSWAIIYRKKKPSSHPTAWSWVTSTIGFESISPETGWENAFPRSCQAAAYPWADVLPTQLEPQCLANLGPTSPVMWPQIFSCPSVQVSEPTLLLPAGLLGCLHILGCSLASGDGERRPWRSSGSCLGILLETSEMGSECVQAV